MTNVAERLRKKAGQSICTYKVSAIGFNRKGDYIGHSINVSRFMRQGGGKHAEMRLLQRYGNKISTIFIARFGKSGNFLPINACQCCQKVADKLGVRIVSVTHD